MNSEGKKKKKTDTILIEDNVAETESSKDTIADQEMDVVDKEIGK